MKSKTLIIVCALLCCISANAKVTDEPVKLTKNNTHSNGGPHRSPEPSVIVIINDTYIEFDTLYSGCNVTIIDSDGLTVYSLIIDENGIISLPDNIEGIFELQLYVYDDIYTGEIEL